MKIFKELKKLGYKHYTEHTIEELDNLPLNSEERIIEQSLVFRWFRVKYNLWNMIYPRDGWNYTIQEIDNIPSVFGQSYHNTEMKTYEEAELECLKRLIKVINENNYRKIN